MTEKLLRTHVINEDDVEIEMVISCDTEENIVTITFEDEIEIVADWDGNMKQLFKEALELWE
jgi:frataxin-like iron-binding protein CyaY